MSEAILNSREGNLNPMYGKRHDLQTKKKISNSQKARYAAIRKALDEKTIFRLAEDDIKARKDVLRQLVTHNELNFKSIQQAVNFLAIVLGKDYIAQVIQDEIDKELCTLDTSQNVITTHYRGK